MLGRQGKQRRRSSGLEENGLSTMEIGIDTSDIDTSDKLAGKQKMAPHINLQ